jgi:TetR/AcrR family fatty acid metabolism transcriptional regulator
MRSEFATGDQARSFIERARRAQIIDCAIDVIAERGLTSATLAEIAKRAGVSKGVISYHFAGKNELIQQVVESVYGEAFSQIFEAMEREETAAGKLSTYISANLDFMQKNHKRMLAMVQVFTTFRKDDGTLFYDASHSEELLSALASVCAAGQAAGEFRDFDPRLMALTIQSTLDAILVEMPFRPDADLSHYANELTQLFSYATRKETHHSERAEL